MCHLSRDVANTTWRVLSSDERGKYLALPRKAPITENGVQVVNASEFYCLLCSMEEADTHYFEGFTYEELMAHLHHQYVHIYLKSTDAQNMLIVMSRSLRHAVRDNEERRDPKYRMLVRSKYDPCRCAKWIQKGSAS